MKAANSYGSLLRGVSQQVPQDRAEGQHTEQVNLLSDPVNGLTRRHGSEWLAERAITGLEDAAFPDYVKDTDSWTTHNLINNGKEYTLLIRRAQRVGLFSYLPFMFAYNRTDKKFLNPVYDTPDTPLAALELAGVSAVTTVGKYIFMTSNDAVIAGASAPTWNTSDNFSKAVIWVRGGAFSRKYTVTVRLQPGSPVGLGSVTITYTTPSSSYQTPLDTSDIPTSDPDYTKKVNDRVNAYNGAVTQWIGTSTAAIQPEAIAANIAGLLSSSIAGVTTKGSHVIFPPTALVRSIEVDDGGDGSLIREVADEIESVDKTSVIHYVGKVVKVRSKNAAESFYLKAVGKGAAPSGYTEVTWVEAAGVEQQITGGLFYATIVGDNIYVASSASKLGTLTPGPHPSFSVSTAGDEDSSAMPFFVGRKVTYLGTFQNRLLIGSGGVLAVSKTDDYLNFFRSTVLTTPADDPFEMQPTGSEDDILRDSTLYDQDLVLFGDNRQYVVRGSVTLTPTTANMAVMANYEGAAGAPPVSAGGFIFYSKRSGDYSSVHQIQPGLTENSPESFPASSQIDSYIQGDIIEFSSASGSPSMLFARATGKRNSVYCFAYLDKQDGRKMDSWSRWDFGSVLGVVIGMKTVTGGVEVYFLRRSSLGQFYVVADFISTSPLLSGKPYLDSHRPWWRVTLGTTSLIPTSGSNWAAAFDDTSTRRFTGTLLPDVPSLLAAYPSEPGLTAGALQDAYFTPTNPFMRDGNGKAIMSGRLTITKLLVAFKQSIGLKWELRARAVPSSAEFNGRVLGDPNNIVGVEPISTGQYSLPVGIETRQYEVDIKARRWYPFTITAIEWVGQFFNRVQRF